MTVRPRNSSTHPRSTPHTLAPPVPNLIAAHPRNTNPQLLSLAPHPSSPLLPYPSVPVPSSQYPNIPPFVLLCLPFFTYPFLLTPSSFSFLILIFTPIIQPTLLAYLYLNIPQYFSVSNPPLRTLFLPNSLLPSPSFYTLSPLSLSHSLLSHSLPLTPPSTPCVCDYVHHNRGRSVSTPGQATHRYFHHPFFTHTRGAVCYHGDPSLQSCPPISPPKQTPELSPFAVPLQVLLTSARLGLFTSPVS